MDTSDFRHQRQSLLYRIRNSHVVRLTVLGILTLILLIPISMIRNLILERQERSHEAALEVTSRWGLRQIVTGPALILPYSVREKQKASNGELVEVEIRRDAIILPKELKVTGVIATENRGRGIFQVPVYTLTLNLAGRFEKPRIDTLGIDPSVVRWGQAHLSVGISDVRALRSSSRLTWNDSQSEFLPGTEGLPDSAPGLHAMVPASAQDSGYQFSFPISLNGSESVYVTPFSEETVVQLSSNFPNPNFKGNWLPTERKVSDSGFEATWRVSYLGRNYPQLWTSGTNLSKAIAESQFGVELNDPMDHYRMADRSVKYAAMFILLTFASIWLSEVLAGTHVHPVQYLMLGAAMCLFYLLELSLSEHIAFAMAYGIASIAIVGMVVGYGKTIFRQGNRSFVVATGVTLLYAYLFVVLTNEDAALLVGSIGLFVILAGIMFVTRGINWYASPAPTPEP